MRSSWKIAFSRQFLDLKTAILVTFFHHIYSPFLGIKMHGFWWIFRLAEGGENLLPLCIKYWTFMSPIGEFFCHSRQRKCYFFINSIPGSVRAIQKNPPDEFFATAGKGTAIFLIAYLCQ
jgi:hypothetical protein